MIFLIGQVRNNEFNLDIILMKSLNFIYNETSNDTLCSQKVNLRFIPDGKVFSSLIVALLEELLNNNLEETLVL